MQKTGNYFQFPCRRLASASAAAAGLGGTHDAVVGYEPAGLVAIISSFAGVLLKSNQHLNAPCPENCEPADRPGNVCHINQMNTGKHELGRTRAGKVHPLTCRVIWHRFFFLQEFHEDIARQLKVIIYLTQHKNCEKLDA